VLLLAAGRFCEQKNFGAMVEVAIRLRDSGTLFHLVMGGEGEQWDTLSARFKAAGLEKQVTLPGNLTNLDEVMQAADIFVMTSLWEGLPLVLLEAMAAGLPTVAFRIPGVAEVVAEGETGELVPVGDTEAMAGELVRLIGSRDTRRNLGASGLELIRTRYSFDEYVDSLTRLYGTALTRTREE